MNKKIYIIISLFLTFTTVYAGLINVNVYNGYAVKSIIFSPKAGKYALFTENGKITEISSETYLTCTAEGNLIKVELPSRTLGSFEKVHLVGKEFENNYLVKPLIPSRKEKRLDDNLKLRALNGELQLINNIEIDNYIAGVVEAEVGSNPAEEFFKLQAILARTYALSIGNKHQLDGYNLCDQVHCQAYHGKCKDPRIVTAAKSTSNTVVVDSDIQLITAAFYSNCGGHTVNSEDVWTQPVDYLRAVPDTNCTHEPHAQWQRKILIDDWQLYLKHKFGYTEDHLSHPCVTNFQQIDRKVHFDCAGQTIPLKDIRNDWKLRSTFFEIEPNGNEIIINGKGFGHGVGLCQEGAMFMAKSGCSYIDILHHYYQNVHLMNLDVMDFFKE